MRLCVFAGEGKDKGEGRGSVYVHDLITAPEADDGDDRGVMSAGG